MKEKSSFKRMTTTTIVRGEFFSEKRKTLAPSPFRLLHAEKGELRRHDGFQLFLLSSLSNFYHSVHRFASIRTNILLLIISMVISRAAVATFCQEYIDCIVCRNVTGSVRCERKRQEGRKEKHVSAKKLFSAVVA